MNLHQLFERIRKGDEEATICLYKKMRCKFREPLFFRVGPSWEDHLHDLFLIVLKAIQDNRIEHPEFVWTYCWTVLNRNVAADVRRKRQVVPIDRSYTVPATQETDAAHAEQLTIADRLVDKLPETQRRIVKMFYGDERPKVDIERELKITDTQFRLSKSRALGALQRKARMLKFRPIEKPSDERAAA